MYREMGFSVLETREVTPRPGWSFRSHLIVIDAERLVRAPPVGKSVAAMASAVSFVGLGD
jgi:hypothetical protein